MDPHQSYPSTFFAKKGPVKRMNQDISGGIQEQFPAKSSSWGAVECGWRWITIGFSCFPDPRRFLRETHSFLRVPQPSSETSTWPGWESFMAPVGFSLRCCDRTSVSGGKTEMHVAPRISASDWLYRLKCSKALVGQDWNWVEIEMKVNLWTLLKSTAHRWS